MKKFWYWLLFYSIFTLSLTGCSGVKKLSTGVTRLLAPAHIAKLTPSLVLITNEKRGENGTGFFVAGEKNVCTVLTTRHIIGMSSPVRLQTSDLKLWITNKIQLFPNHDLALVTFDAGSQDCPYKALKFGNSNSLKIGDDVYIAGFVKEAESKKISNYFASTRILMKQDVTDGYAISYNAITPYEMGGSPVFDKIGNVVAIHGLTDGEVSLAVMLKGDRLLQKPQPVVNTNFNGAERETADLKWAIPIKTYLANVHKLSVSDVGSVQSAEKWLSIGHDFSAYRLKEDALASYDKAIEIKSNFADAWYSRGNALFNLQRYEQAVASYDKAIQFKSGFAKAWFSRGWALYHLKRYEQAVASYDKAIQFKSGYALAWVFRGHALYDWKRYQDAVASYDKAIQVNPNNPDTWSFRGNALSELKRYEDALASYDKAIQVNPNVVSSAWWFKRGNALYNLKRYEDALASYDKATQIYHKDADAWYNQGLVLSKLKRYKQAVASYDKAIQIKSDFAKAWYNRGFALSDLKRYDDAVASYDKAIKIKPNFADAWLMRGFAFYDLKRYDDAVASYDKAIKIKPDFADAWFGRSMVLVFQGRNQEALESVEKGLQINPNLQYGQDLRKTILQQLKG